MGIEEGQCATEFIQEGPTKKPGLKDEQTMGWWKAGEGHSGFTEQREQRGRTGNVQRNCKVRGDWPAGSHIAEEEAWVSEASWTSLNTL